MRKELENSANVFSPAVMAQIKAKTSTSVDEIRAWKLRLVRRMSECGYGRETIPLSSAFPVCGQKKKTKTA